MDERPLFEPRKYSETAPNEAPLLASVAGGWNNTHLQVTNLDEEVKRLRAAGVSFRTNEVVTGTGGSQIIIDDPSGNPIELVQPQQAAAPKERQTPNKSGGTHGLSHVLHLSEN